MPKKFAPVLIVSFFVSLFLLSAFLSFIYFTTKTKSSTPRDYLTQTQNTSRFPSPLPTPIDNSINILLFGFGGGNHPGGSLTDTLILLHFNPDLNKLHLISVPRDTWLGQAKINTAYSQSPASAKQQTALVTGLPVHYYVAVSFTGFQNVVDALDGIEVDVPVTFDDYFYPVKGLEELSCDKTPEELQAINATLSGFLLEREFPCRYEHLHFDKGPTPMDGATALKFVRSRHSDQHGGDFARSQRQIALLQAVKAKALSLGALDNLPSFFNEFVSMISTDLDLATLEKLASSLTEPEAIEVNQIILNTDNVFVDSRGPSGEYILIPKAGMDDWQSVHAFISQALN